MHTESVDALGNRAVTAMFRVFGGRGLGKRGDAGEGAALRGMHLLEYRLLAVWIPLSVLVAVAHPLIQGWGWIFGTIAAFPVGFLLINVLPYALSARSATMQWRMWLGLFVVWAWFHRDVGGVTAAFAWGWLGLACINGISWAIDGILTSLSGSGPRANAWRMFLLIFIHAVIIALGFATDWRWALMAGAFVAAMLCIAILHPSCQWLGPVKTHVESAEILITIDDGPDPHDTPKLLDLLDAHQVKAIFFMIGEKVRAHPELAREVIRRGHEIGNHTMTHPQASFWCAGPRRTRREIAECNQIIESITGVKPRCFRAPVGHRNGFTHPVTRELGLEVMAWNRRGYDAVEKDAAKVLARILPKLGAGDIVLLHEATPIAEEVLKGVLAHPAAQRRPDGDASA
jgi:peptidoglycan/xylan/chitin deacetylase (PgdA/CDA1 family)